MTKTVVNTTLIGLNRFTASLGLAMREYSKKGDARLEFSVTGQDAGRDAMDAALHFGAVDKLERNAKTAVQKADMVIVSLPAGLIEPLYEFFGASLKNGAVVLDLSSLKTPVVEVAKRCFPKNENGDLQAYLVGIQPFVNAKYLYETSRAVADAKADLFEKSEMIVAPDVSVPPEAVKLATNLSEILGMNARFMNPEEYDALAGFTVHTPTLLGFSLIAAMQNSKGGIDLARTINPDFAVLTNSVRHMVVQDLLTEWQSYPSTTLYRIDELMSMLQRLRTLIANENKDEVEQFVKETLETWEKWGIYREERDWDKVLNPKPTASPRGLFGGLFGMGGGKSDDDKS